MSQDHIFEIKKPKINVFDARRGIVPIVKIDGCGEISQLLGTGFFVGIGEIPVVVTAKHVFNINLKKEEKFGLVCVGHGKKAIADICGLKKSKNHDIAFFYSGLLFSDPISYKLAKGTIPTNEDIFSFEYSPSRMTVNHTGRQILELDAFTHKGNIMRYYNSDFPEKIPTPSFDTSFPALQGASGAPVIRIRDGAVVGMLVANFERNLVPAQILEIENEKGHLEETRYFLPTGKAIMADLIIDYLKSKDISLEAVE